MKLDPKKYSGGYANTSLKNPVRGDVFRVFDGTKIRPAVIVSVNAGTVRVLFCTSKEHSGRSQYEIEDTTAAGLNGISYVIRDLAAVRVSDLRGYIGRLTPSDQKGLNIASIVNSSGATALRGIKGNDVYNGDYQNRVRNRFQ